MRARRRRSPPLAALLVAGCGGSSGPKGPPALLFVSIKDGDYAIFGADADGKHTYRLTDGRGRPVDARGALLPDRAGMVARRHGDRLRLRPRRPAHIFVMDADGTGTRRVTNTQQGRPSDLVGGRQRIVFAREGALFRVRRRAGADAGRQGLRRAADPAYSPDGKCIAYDYRRPGFSIRRSS